MTKPKITFIAIILIFLFAVLWFAIGCPPLEKCPGGKVKKANQPKVSLSFMGPWDSTKDWSEIFEKFNAYKKLESNGFLDVSIKYEVVNGDYEDAIKDLQYKSKGPNIFMLFNSWLPKYEDDILPAPKEMMSLTQFKNTFAKVTAEDFTTTDGKIYSLPLYVDTLALFYNEDMLLQAGYIEPPKDWDEFKNYVENLSRFKKETNTTLPASPQKNVSEKEIEIAGATFGGGWNVNRSQDIIILLAMQNNINTDEETLSFRNQESKDAINFYTSFTDPAKRFYTWNEDWMYSIDAFVQNKAAMMINYSYAIENIDEKTQGELNYRIAPIPQLDENHKVNYANYWSPVVPAIAPCDSKVKVDCRALAWEFIKFATQEVNAKIYLDNTNRPAANLKLAREQFNQTNGIRSIFAGQVLTAKGWEHPDSENSDIILVELIDHLTSKDLAKELVDKEITTNDIIESAGRKIKALQ